MRRFRLPKTKIICTLGPATTNDQTISALIDAGMSIARLNLSHGSLDQHSADVKRIRIASEIAGVPVGIMVDVPGAKYRTGRLAAGSVHLDQDDSIILTSRDVDGNKKTIPVSPPGIHKDAVDAIFLDDGLIELSVDSVIGEDVYCSVVRGGQLTERRGVATPGKSPSQPFPDNQGMEALKFAAEHNVDFVALSTITSPKDVVTAREILSSSGLETFVISKIERAEALEHFDKILEISDGIMVARGDMGVEVKLAQIPIIQKDLITKSNLAGKPVITATQMLESMIHHPIPTRAEVTDVANAIYDGTDAIMLSGETSVGKYPVEAVKIMSDVAIETESALPYDRMLIEKRQQQQPTSSDAISYDACNTAYQLNAALIVAFTESGTTAGNVSKYRPKPPILALTPNDWVRRQLTIRWGVFPTTVPRITSAEDLFTLGENHAKNAPEIDSGNLVVLVAGLPIGVPGGTNLLRVLSVT